MKRLLLLTFILAFGVLSAFSEDIHIFDVREPASQSDAPKQIRIPKSIKREEKKNPLVFGVRGIFQVGYGELGPDLKEYLMYYSKSQIEEEADICGGFAVFMRKTFESRFGFQLETGYTVNSFGLKFVPADSNYDEYWTPASMSINTFNFAALACYTIPVNQTVSFMPLLGLQAGILTDGWVIELENELYKGFDGEENIRYIWNEPDTVAVASLVAGVSFSAGVFVLDARFNYWLNPVTIDGYVEARFLSGAISAGFEFKF